jgi:phosphoglycerate dehydrogenase-like enzyme
MSWHVLVTARAFWFSGDQARAALEQAGCTIAHSPNAGPVPEDELIALLSDCDAVIASSDPYTARLFRECPKLKVVSRCGVGYDSVDVNSATEAGVIVTTTPGAMTDAVADYTWGLILALARKIPAGDALMHTGGWGEYPGVLVCGKTLGLVGLGAIGRGVARRASGFDMKILAYDPAWTVVSELPPGMPPIEFTSLDEVLARSDFVSLHAPNTPETRKMFNSARFAQMKRTAYFINTARGALVDESALVEALKSATIAGAAVDVYTAEPCPPDDPLRSAPNCVLTPHNAFNAMESAEAMSNLSAENILAVMRGERPAGILNPEVLERADVRVRQPLDQ